MAITLERDYEEDFIITGKRRLRDIILADRDISELLKDDVPEEELAKINSVDNPYIQYEYVMPFPFVPTAQTRETCFMCLKMDAENTDDNNPFAETYYITIIIFCSPLKQNFGQGMNRLDALSFCLKDIFNFSNPLGMEWILMEDNESVLTAGNAGIISRVLDFKSNGFNYRNRAKDFKKGSVGGMKNPYWNRGDSVNPAMKRTRQGAEVYTDEEL